MMPYSMYLRIDVDANREWLVALIDTDVRVALSEQHYWVSWNDSDEPMRRLVASLPGVRFSTQDGRTLQRTGHRVAEASIPDLDWKKAIDFVQLKLPSVIYARRWQAEQLPRLALVRGGSEAVPGAAIISIGELKHWVDRAPTWRLKLLQYCWDGHEVLVMGNPLPPIPFQYYTVHDRILIPAGMEWIPRLDAQQVANAFGLANGDWILWGPQSQFLIRDDRWVAMSRSSIRNAWQQQRAALYLAGKEPR